MLSVVGLMSLACKASSTFPRVYFSEMTKPTVTV